MNIDSKKLYLGMDADARKALADLLPEPGADAQFIENFTYLEKHVTLSAKLSMQEMFARHALEDFKRQQQEELDMLTTEYQNFAATTKMLNDKIKAMFYYYRELLKTEGSDKSKEHG